MSSKADRSEKRFTKAEKSWIMYDWANSIYATNIMAAIFPIYFAMQANETGNKLYGFAVSAAALESRNGDSGVVLLAASSKVTNANGAQQDPRSWRMSVTLTRDGGQLKMSNVEFVP